VGRVTVAPITGTIRGLSTEVLVGPRNGLDHAGVVSCDNIVAIPVDTLGRQVAFLLADREEDTTAAIRAAFDLDRTLAHAV
jgi:mRNA interferase MazF